MSGFDPVLVFDWLDAHGKRRDGRFVELRGRALEDTHRDTFERWEGFALRDPEWIVPLGRFDEILVFYGLMLYEYEQWATEIYGTSGFKDQAHSIDELAA